MLSYPPTILVLPIQVWKEEKKKEEETNVFYIVLLSLWFEKAVTSFYQHLSAKLPQGSGTNCEDEENQVFFKIEH